MMSTAQISDGELTDGDVRMEFIHPKLRVWVASIRQSLDCQVIRAGFHLFLDLQPETVLRTALQKHRGDGKDTAFR